jgi:hypothetical protein
MAAVFSPLLTVSSFDLDHRPLVSLSRQSDLAGCLVVEMQRSGSCCCLGTGSCSALGCAVTAGTSGSNCHNNNKSLFLT